jgi:hypothetical protein
MNWIELFQKKKSKWLKKRKKKKKKPHKEMLNISAIKVMQIKTTLKFHFTPFIEWLPSGTQTTNIGKDVGGKEPSYTAGGNVNYYNHYGKKYGISSKIKNRTGI